MTDPGSVVRHDEGRAMTRATSDAQQSWASASTLVGVAGIGAYFLLASKIGAGFAIPVGIIGVCGLVFLTVLKGPVGRAWARRIDGGTSGASEGEIDALYARIEELEAGQQRVADLEERLDFTERLLARSRDEQVSADPST